MCYLTRTLLAIAFGGSYLLLPLLVAILTIPPDNNLVGDNFWLGKLNQFNGNFVNAELEKAV
jgi:hypothetical protein